MCGIFGYIGPDNSASICIEGLKNLEYRGYDSSGIAGILEGDFFSCKEVGKIEVLEKAIENVSKRLDLAIAHTRWATHGVASKLNAHPHFDEKNTIAVVHNGIIENHHALRNMLSSEGITFSSDTDTEVVAQLIAHFYEDDIYSAVQKTVHLLQGSYSLAIIHINHPDQIIAVARETPLVIAQTKSREETFLSSDANALPAKELDVFFMKNDEIAVIKSKTVDVFDTNSNKIVKSLERLGLENTSISKKGYEHFMLKEIFEQPESIKQALNGRLKYDMGTVEFENVHFSLQELLSVKRILILACGSSYHAGAIAASLFENQARIPTHVEIASQFRYKNPIISPDTLVIAISQSGETLDTMGAIREAKAKGAKILGICNVPNSSLTREADSIIFFKSTDLRSAFVQQKLSQARSLFSLSLFFLWPVCAI